MRIPRIAVLGSVLLGRVFAQTATIDFNAKQQVIDGFGASSAWHGTLTSTELDAAFSNTNQNQLGLSILRVDIDPAGESNWGSQKANASEAKKRGAKYVLATPWSPPASMKDNNNTTGGSLKTGAYGDYASYLKSYRTYMGSLVDVISIQNEPDIKVTYTSCDWTATQIFNFAKNNAATIGGSVMASESWHFDVGMTDPILADSKASANISHIGLHLYSATMKTDSKAVAAGKRIWMTEHYYNADDISTSLTLGKEIMDCLNNRMNAYIWWYLRMPDCNLINSDGSIKLKGYVMGQFSKYVRPGSYRVTATYSPQTKVTVLAFTGDRNVIVALNQNASAVSQTFKISGGVFDSAKVYVTSSSKKLAASGSVKTSSGSFTASLAAQSVTTFVADVQEKSGMRTSPGGAKVRGRVLAFDAVGKVLLDEVQWLDPATLLPSLPAGFKGLGFVRVQVVGLEPRTVVVVGN